MCGYGLDISISTDFSSFSFYLLQSSGFRTVRLSLRLARGRSQCSELARNQAYFIGHGELPSHGLPPGCVPGVLRQSPRARARAPRAYFAENRPWGSRAFVAWAASSAAPSSHSYAPSHARGPLLRRRGSRTNAGHCGNRRHSIKR